MLFPVCSSVIHHQMSGGSTSLVLVNALAFFPWKGGKIPEIGFWKLKGGYLNNMITPTDTLGDDRACHQGAPILPTCTTLAPPGGVRDHCPKNFIALMDRSDIHLPHVTEKIMGQGSRKEQETLWDSDKTQFLPCWSAPYSVRDLYPRLKISLCRDLPPVN